MDASTRVSPGSRLSLPAPWNWLNKVSASCRCGKASSLWQHVAGCYFFCSRKQLRSKLLTLAFLFSECHSPPVFRLGVCLCVFCQRETTSDHHNDPLWGAVKDEINVCEGLAAFVWYFKIKFLPPCSCSCCLGSRSSTRYPWANLF